MAEFNKEALKAEFEGKFYKTCQIVTFTKYEKLLLDAFVYEKKSAKNALVERALIDEEFQIVTLVFKIKAKEEASCRRWIKLFEEAGILYKTDNFNENKIV